MDRTKLGEPYSNLSTGPSCGSLWGNPWVPSHIFFTEHQQAAHLIGSMVSGRFGRLPRICFFLAVILTSHAGVWFLMKLYLISNEIVQILLEKGHLIRILEIRFLLVVSNILASHLRTRVPPFSRHFEQGKAQAFSAAVLRQPKVRSKAEVEAARRPPEVGFFGPPENLGPPGPRVRPCARARTRTGSSARAA